MINRLRHFLCALIALCALLAGASACADGLEVHFLNVERNDGILITCGGESAFIDSGFRVWGEMSVDYMRSVGVDDLRYYIGSHAHKDHIGGAPVIIEQLKPDIVYQPHDRVRTQIAKFAETEREKQAVAAADYRTMKRGDKVKLGGALIECLGPVTVVDVKPAKTAENANSLVLKVSYGEVSFLLTGDATGGELKAIEAASPGCLRATVFKNPHHNGETKDDILNAVQPEYTVFSTASKNLPVRRMVKKLLNMGSEVFLTADKHCGTIVMTTDGKEVNVKTQYEASSLTLNYAETTVYEGKTVSLKAAMKPSSRYKYALYWSSDDPSVATVNADGKVTGVKQGETVIRVRDGAGTEAACRVVVSPATVVMKKSAYTVRQHARVSVGYKLQPSGVKAKLTWSSADPSIATVDAKGRVTGVYPGETVITAAMPNGQKASVPVTVTPVSVKSVKISPSSVKMTLGDSKTVAAKVSPSRATWPEVTWTSADESIVTVTQDGKLKAVGVGQTTITATTKEGKSRTAKVTVNPVYVKKILLSGRTGVLVGGVAGRNQVQLSCEIQPANATIKDVVWTSSNKKVAVVDENGVVTGLAAGKVTITCKAADGSKRYAKIKLTFGANELKQTVKPVIGELIAAPSRIRYVSGQLEVSMTFQNRTGERQQVPGMGVLTLITPEGEQIPLTPLAASRQYTLKNKGSRTIRYRVPVSAQTAGLDLTRSDAVIIVPAGR